MTVEKSLLARLESLVLSTEQVRRVDALAVERFGMNSLVLMENAALGCVAWLKSQFPNCPQTLILCGRGNNGGDGLAIARHLQTAGWPVRVVMATDRGQLSPDARANFDILTASGDSRVVMHADGGVPPETVFSRTPGVILDCMLGTGASGPLRPPFEQWSAWANSQSATRVAIDVPTGVDAETGVCSETFFQADATLTFVARKPGMLAENADQLFGRIQVLPIGIPAKLIEELLAWQI